VETVRPIKYIVWHSAATREGVDVSVATIRKWHLYRGFSDIGYHYVIGLDGVVRDGRDLANPGAHVQGHNDNSVGICYVGGVGSDGEPKDTRTPIQKAALYALTERLLKMFPGAEVRGHRDFAATACPSFDAKKDWASRDGALSPDITPGLSPADMRDSDFEQSND
jgi:N-acetylmuramoyl-L-alanine amidase